MLKRAFGVSERSFRLNGASWRDLEKALDSGLGEIAARLAPLVNLKATGAKAYPGGVMQAIALGQMGAARLDDVRESLLQGLIGAKELSTTEAGALVSAVFDEAIERGGSPMMDWCDLAFTIVTGAIVGLADEPPPGEQKAAKPPARRRSRTAKPAS